VTTSGIVRFWRDEDGWGVIDSPETPGGCWTHFSHVRVAGYCSLTTGQQVELDWEAPGQDGYAFRAMRTWPSGQQPVEPTVHPHGPGHAYRSTLTIRLDSDGPATTGGPSS